MAVNGSAIYGTRRSSFPEPKWGRLTTKSLPDGGKRLHAFVYDPQPKTTLLLAGPSGPPARAYVLETGETVPVESAEGGFSFTLPEYLPDQNIVALTFEWPGPHDQ